LLQYSLLSVKKLTSYLNSLESLPIKNIQEEKIGITKGFQFAFDQATGVFTIRVLADFLCQVENPEPLKLFGATVQFEYLFKDYEEVVKQTGGNKVDIPDDLLITLMSISFSPSRGILAALTAGTDYQNIFLPIVNIQEFKTMLTTLHSDPDAK
jgi:hypothetical protein